MSARDAADSEDEPETFDDVLQSVGRQLEHLVTATRALGERHRAEVAEAVRSLARGPKLETSGFHLASFDEEAEPLPLNVECALGSVTAGEDTTHVDGTGSGSVEASGRREELPLLCDRAEGPRSPRRALGDASRTLGLRAATSSKEVRAESTAKVQGTQRSVGFGTGTSPSRPTFELEKVWERPKRGIERRFSSGGGDGCYNVDVFAQANFTNAIARSRFTEDLSNSLLQKLVTEPSSAFSMVWNLCEVVLLTYDLLVIPVLVANMAPPDTFVSRAMLYISVVFWTADIPTSFFKGYVTRSGDLEMRLGFIAGHYVKSRFCCDLLLLTIEWVNFSIASMEDNYASSGRLLRLLRFSRLLKIGKMQRLLQALTQRVRSNVMLTVFGMTKVIAFILLTNHMVACMWFAVEDDQLVPLPTFGERYSTSLHWSLAQMGFGTTNIFPDTTMERMFSAIVAVVSLMLLSFLVGSVVTGMTRLQMLLRAQREQEEHLRDYLSRHGVSWPLRNRIWVFVFKTQKIEKKHVLEANVDLIKKLPKAMLFELRAEVYIPILTVHPFFGTYAVSSADKYAMHTLVEKFAVSESELDAECELFIMGEPAQYMYFLVSGRLLYRQGGNSHVFHDSTASSGQGQAVRKLSTIGDGDHMDDSHACGPGEWLSEACLWLRWTHMGSAVAKFNCEVVSLHAEKFQQIMYQFLPQACRYAHLFVEYALEVRDHINDVFIDASRLRSMAHDVFEPPVAFQVVACTPTVDELRGRNEWKPSTRRQWQKLWTTPWKDAHALNRGALLSTMTTDMKHDIIMMYQTLFSQHFPTHLGSSSWISAEDQMLHDKRVVFMKRLVLCFASCRLGLTTENNSAKYSSWPFPLASVFCHGSRMLLRLDGVHWKEFVNFLMFGQEDAWSWDESGVPGPLYIRRAASHGVRVDPRTSELQEIKLNNLQAFGNNHLGMDLPVGGLGNPAPNHKAGSLHIGPSGVPYKRGRRKRGPTLVREIQHGHLYMRWDDFGSKTVPVLKGPGSDWPLYPTPSLSNSVASPRSHLSPQRSTDPRSTDPRSTDGRMDLRSTEGRMDVRSTDGRMDLRSTDGRCTDTRSSDARLDQVSLDPTSSASQVYSSRQLKRMRSRKSGGLYAALDPQMDWTPLPHLRSVEELENFLRESNLEHLADEHEMVTKLFVKAAKGQELVIEADREKNLRCRGVMVHLVVELAPTEDEPDVPPRLLVHTSAEATYNLSSEDCPKSVKVKDLRVLTVPCAHHETWNTALSRYCQQVFQLSDTAVSRLIAGCLEATEDDTFTYKVPPAATISFHHEALFAQSGLPVVYDAIRVKTRLYDKDRQMFGAFMNASFHTLERHVDLHGFAGFPSKIGAISREWTWVTEAEAMDTKLFGSIAGLDRPEEACTLVLSKETKRLSSLLIGIESSAPLKEDLFGNTHTVDAKSKDRSAFGKPKWRAYGKGGQEVPADLGGIKVTIDEAGFQFFQEVCRVVGCHKPSAQDVSEKELEEERALFRDLLQDDDDGVERILMEYLESKGVFLPDINNQRSTTTTL